jgi:tetratricopeptide (TPR) repeat protein
VNQAPYRGAADQNLPPAPPERQSATCLVEAMLLAACRHHRTGHLTEAARTYREILAICPEQPDSLHMLGMIAYEAGRAELAVTLIRKAIAVRLAINDEQASHYSNLGIVLQSQGNIDEAATCFEKALNLNPGLAEVHINLGNILHDKGSLNDALSCSERALALKPDLAEAHHSMGNVLQALDGSDGEKPRLQEAVTCYERALALKPGYAQAHYNLGCALAALGQSDNALGQYRIALELQPAYSLAGFRKSLVQLQRADFAAGSHDGWRKGWQNYEWRWQCPLKDHGTPMRSYSQPLWTGEKLASGRLLIWAEQGVGDEIMFAGVIPDVLRTGTPCVLDCDRRLQPLFARAFPDVEVVAKQSLPENDADEGSLEREPRRDIAAHIPIGSVPSFFRTTNASFGITKSPYLFADSAARERFRARYRGTDSLQQGVIGLAWHTTNRKTGRYRSIDLAQFTPLFAQPNIRWISLQYGDHDALQEEADEAKAPLLIDRSVDQLADLDIFAAQIAALDLVITIDNSTAHLAGALGLPTWLLLPYSADWRWLEKRADSPWYPTLRLFRQPQRGDWGSVIEEIRAEISTQYPVLSTQ